MKTIFLDGDDAKPLEMGANWIHGLWGNPMYKIIQENGHLFHHKKQKLFSENLIYFVDEYGRVLDPLMCLEFYDIYKIWNAEAKSVWINNLKSSFNSYSEFMLAKYEKHVENDSDETKRIKRALLKRLLIAETIESGSASMDQVSLNEYGSYEIPIGPDYEFPGGYSKLIQFLADKLPYDLIKLNHAVKKISLQNILSNEENLMLVECFNGARFRSKHVVVTVSSSYLQHNYKTLFCPGLLSERKIKAINSIKMDTVDKIFMFYDDLSFFPAQIEAIHPIFLETKDEIVNQDNWAQKTSSFHRFYDNIIMTWVTGKEAAFMEGLDDTLIAIKMTELLRRLLKNNKLPMPNKIIK